MTFALAVGLGGCSYVRSYMAQSDLTDANAYCQLKRSDPAVQPLFGKLPIIGLEEITPEMLSLDTVPSDSDVVAIKALSRDQLDCRQHLRAVTKGYRPTEVATDQALDLKLDLVTAELLKRHMSYGNANRLYQEAALEASNKLTEQAQQEMADAAEREAATWRSLGQSLATVPKAKTPSPQADKSCSWIDSTVGCNTR